MKKALYFALSVALLSSLTACGDREELAQDAVIKDTVWEETALCAVAYLGYDYGDFVVESPELYLSDWEEIPVCEAGGVETYLIIPRNDTVVGAVSSQSMGEEDMELGEVMYDIAEGKAFILRCNESDIFPNAVLTLASGEKEVSFSPYISLKDGSLMLAEGVQDITKSGEA